MNFEDKYFIKWIDKNERLPEKEGNYLITYYHCHAKVHRVFTMRYTNRARFSFDSPRYIWAHRGLINSKSMTHWAELPNPALC